MSTAAETPRHLIKVVGELDVANANRLRSMMAAIDPPAQIVIDASELLFMDSAGISVLLETVARGASVTLANPTPIIRTLIEATGLTETVQMAQ